MGLIAKARDRDNTPIPAVRWGTAALATGAGLLAFTSVVANERLAAAKTALVAGRDDHAAADARSALRFAPWSVDALELQAVARAHQGRNTEALALYREIVEQDPDSWIAWTQLAAASTGAERRHAEAIALRLNPRTPRV